MAKKPSDKSKQKRLAKKKAARKLKQKAKAKASAPQLRLVPGGKAGAGAEDAHDDLPFPMPDMRAMEATLRDLFGKQESTPDVRAQDLMYQAFEAESRAKRIALAHQALDESANCADAYVLLADEEASTEDEAMALLREGVAAGERMIGPENFEQNVGHFWGVLETRPYMRARANLAQCLWAAGDEGNKAEAVDHYRELLRLNPNDNQGNRDTLLVHLIELGEDAEAAELLGKYLGDRTASSLYSRALLAFRRAGDGEAARHAAGEALTQNEHVPALLLAEDGVPQEAPDYMGFGDANEAVIYVTAALSGWEQTPGALSWLAARAEAEGVGE